MFNQYRNICTFLMMIKGTLPSSPYRPDRLVDLFTHNSLRKQFRCTCSMSFDSMYPDTSFESTLEKQVHQIT